MARFRDSYLSRKVVGYPAQVAPKFSTQLVSVDSGAEHANSRWANALREISLTEGVRDHETFEALKAHWLVMVGPRYTWPWRDPTDFASCALTKVNQVPSVSILDCPIGVGNGVQVAFQLTKRYATDGSPTFRYDRPIQFPIVSTVVIGLDGLESHVSSPPIAFTVSRPGGVVTFASPPAIGVMITAGFLFDLQVRFEDDDTFRGIMRTFGVSGFADVPLMEVRYCEDD